MTPRNKFIRWYIRPFNRLKKIKNGDGAYIALSMALFLCERYYRIKSNTTKVNDSAPFLDAAARDFDCSLDLFKKFWNIFRHGIQHQGSPNNEIRAVWLPSKPVIQTKWAIGGDLPFHPCYVETDSIRRVGIDPWKFADFVLKKFLTDSNALADVSANDFGDELAQPASIPIIIIERYI